MIDAARLRELLDYDPATGTFTWRTNRSFRADAGTLAGSVTTDGYRSIYIDGQNYLAHRLAWLYVHGVWPPADVDHENGNRFDNRIGNLRAATRAENLQNQRRARSDNRTGLLGVGFRADRQKWRAHIGVNGRQMHLGYFSSPESAHDAYVAAKRRMHEFGTI